MFVLAVARLAKGESPWAAIFLWSALQFACGNVGILQSMSRRFFPSAGKRSRRPMADASDNPAIRSVLWVPVNQRATREMEIMSCQCSPTSPYVCELISPFLPGKVGHVLDLSARFHNDKKTGELLSVLSRAHNVSFFLVCPPLFPAP